jgi:hypothetical protein
MFTGFGCFPVFFDLPTLAAKQMDCMDDWVRNMDMIRYEYLVCYDD